MSEAKKDGRFRPDEKKRTVRIEVMVTLAEHNEILAAAESRGMRLSEHIRDCVRRWDGQGHSTVGAPIQEPTETEPEMFAPKKRPGAK